jgi:hypothetical protein
MGGFRECIYRRQTASKGIKIFLGEYGSDRCLWMALGEKVSCRSVSKYLQSLIAICLYLASRFYTVPAHSKSIFQFRLWIELIQSGTIDESRFTQFHYWSIVN